MRPGCELVDCKPDSAFIPNAAGFSIYKRVEVAASTALSSSSAGEHSSSPQPTSELSRTFAALKQSVEALQTEVAALRGRGH